MSMSRRTSFLSEIVSGQQVPLGTLSFFRERFRSRLYDLVVSEFLKQEQENGLTRAEVARRIGRKPEQITRWLGAPGNWTVETVSDLLLAIAKGEPEIGISPLTDRPQRNFDLPDWARWNDRQIGLPEEAGRISKFSERKNITSQDEYMNSDESLKQLMDAR